MEVVRQETTNCPACMSPRTATYLTGTVDQFRDLRRLFSFFICRRCRLRFQVVPKEEAVRLFADVQDVAPVHRPGRRRELRCEADVFRVFRTMGVGTRLLDIGSGDGHFLAAARADGFDCLGVDVSKRLAEIARRRSGSEVLVGNLDQLGLPAAAFDVINLDGVLMYVVEPRDFLRSVAALLRPGGICRVREYDPESLIGRWKGKRYWAYAPTHVNIWSAKSIAVLGRAAGLSLVRTFAGTEATLKSWLATRDHGGVVGQALDVLRYALRKARLFGVGMGADTVYYLRKPECPEETASGPTHSKCGAYGSRIRQTAEVVYTAPQSCWPTSARSRGAE